MPSKADALFTDAPLRRRLGRCHVCGAEAPFRVQVVIQGVGRGGKPVQGRMKAQSARYCETHALDTWARFGEQLA